MRSLAPLFAVVLLAGCVAPGAPGHHGPPGPPHDRFPSADPALRHGERLPPEREMREHHEELAGRLRRFMERTERLEGSQKELAQALRRFMERVERLEVATREGRRPDGPPGPGRPDPDELRARAAEMHELRGALERKEGEIRRLRQVVEKLEQVVREKRARLEAVEEERKERDR